MLKSTNDTDFLTGLMLLNSVNAIASYFILFIFIMIETSPYLQKFWLVKVLMIYLL